MVIYPPLEDRKGRIKQSSSRQYCLSTLAKQYLPPECVEYVNFDEIASRLSREGTTENVMAQAGVIALRRIDGNGNPMVFDQEVYNMIFHGDESGNPHGIAAESKAALDAFASSVRGEFEAYAEKDADVVVADDKRNPVVKPARVVLEELRQEDEGK